MRFLPRVDERGRQLHKYIYFLSDLLNFLVIFNSFPKKYGLKQPAVLSVTVSSNPTKLTNYLLSLRNINRSLAKKMTQLEWKYLSGTNLHKTGTGPLAVLSLDNRLYIPQQFQRDQTCEMCIWSLLEKLWPWDPLCLRVLSQSLPASNNKH